MPYFVDPIRQPVETMEIDNFRSARPDDAEAIARLVNQAFRPRTGIVGWTHEAHLVAGDRIDLAQVRQILARGLRAVAGHGRRGDRRLRAA